MEVDDLRLACAGGVEDEQVGNREQQQQHDRRIDRPSGLARDSQRSAGAARVAEQDGGGGDQPDEHGQHRDRADVEEAEHGWDRQQAAAIQIRGEMRGEPIEEFASFRSHRPEQAAGEGPPGDRHHEDRRGAVEGQQLVGGLEREDRDERATASTDARPASRSAREPRREPDDEQQRDGQGDREREDEREGLGVLMLARKRRRQGGCGNDQVGDGRDDGGAASTKATASAICAPTPPADP